MYVSDLLSQIPLVAHLGFVVSEFKYEGRILRGVCELTLHFLIDTLSLDIVIM